MTFRSLLLILLSVWNGAGYYVEVWGRRFERELEALRREVEATQRASAAASGASPSEGGGSPSAEASPRQPALVLGDDQDIDEADVGKVKESQ